MKAREIIFDCHEANRELTDALKKGDQALIRRRWITCLNMLRMVGHSLLKEAENFKDKKEDLDALFKEKKEEEIFNKFIKHERDLALKEYEITLEEKTLKRQENIRIVTNDGEAIIMSTGETIVGNDKEEVEIHSLKGLGFGEGKAPDEIIDEAINWWENYIKKFESFVE